MSTEWTMEHPQVEGVYNESPNKTIQRRIASQEIWIDIDEETHEYDAEIHIHGKDLFEVLDGLSIIRDRINRLNGLN